jgi:hypothetical protein
MINARKNAELDTEARVRSCEVAVDLRLSKACPAVFADGSVNSVGTVSVESEYERPYEIESMSASIPHFGENTQLLNGSPSPAMPSSELPDAAGRFGPLRRSTVLISHVLPSRILVWSYSQPSIRWPVRYDHP